MAAKPTPGPWTFKAGAFGRRVFMPNDVIEVRAEGPARGFVACLYLTNWGEPGMDAANAALISAAPDLLAALKSIKPFAQEMVTDCCADLQYGAGPELDRWQGVLDAIAKATGGE
jgi:hypothetical protein